MFLDALESNKTEESTAVEKMLFYQKAYEKLSGHEDISVEKLIENINVSFFKLKHSVKLTLSKLIL